MSRMPRRELADSSPPAIAAYRSDTPAARNHEARTAAVRPLVGTAAESGGIADKRESDGRRRTCHELRTKGFYR